MFKNPSSLLILYNQTLYSQRNVSSLSDGIKTTLFRTFHAKFRLNKYGDIEDKIGNLNQRMSSMASGEYGIIGEASNRYKVRSDFYIF